VEIPKPDGGVRKLGIPTLLDRFIQQAIMQVLQRRWDPTFSEHSHGFRPKRSAQQAVAKAQQYIAAGHRSVVDLDLEKFFDRVNHDKLMHAIARRITDQRMLRLIGAFLKVGVMENGLVSPAEEGSLEQILKELTAYLRGWKSYFGFCQTPSLLQQMDQRIRHRLRSMIWKQWRRGKQRYGKLRQRGVGKALAAPTAGRPHGPWACGEQPGLVHCASARLLRLSRASAAVRWPCVTL
jgi:hypothetical protein